MKFITRIKEKLAKRKLIKDKMHLFDSVLAAHEDEFYKYKETRAHLNSLFSFLNEYSLSLNFGRQFGHSTYIKRRLQTDPNTVLFYERTEAARGMLGEDFLRKMCKNKRAFNVSSNTRGLDMKFQEGKLITILVDRGCFHKSNKNIIESILENHTGIFQFKHFRVVILG
jgi:hypothetical protein